MVYSDNRCSHVIEERCLFSKCHRDLVISHAIASCILQDIIMLISSGTRRVRKQAEKILMHYWLRPQEKQNGEEILKGIFNFLHATELIFSILLQLGSWKNVVCVMEQQIWLEINV